MRAFAVAFVLAIIACTSSVTAQDRPAAEAVFSTALDNVRRTLPWDAQDLPLGAVIVARRTIGGAPVGYRSFVEQGFGQTIAEELLRSYGEAGPAPRTIEQETVAGAFPVLPLEQFEASRFEYDWARLNQRYPGVRHVVRLSWPAVDRLGTYAVVRYELISRDRPSTSVPPERPWYWASFFKFEKQNDGSWRMRSGEIGEIWK